MNPPPEGWNAADAPYRPRSGVDVIVFPTALDVDTCVREQIVTGAQNGRAEPNGAFTGDVSMSMIASHGCTYVLCGHSERRQHHHESDEQIAAQVQAAIENGLTPILCIGETLDQRELGQAEEIVKQQLSLVLTADSSQLTALVLAYEPVWAIGTGKTATPDDAQAMHAFIRNLIPDTYKEDIRILYGGSVKADSAPALAAMPDIDGFLVGGASLKPQEFAAIIDAMANRA
jgi:triosephosphate isomerase